MEKDRRFHHSHRQLPFPRCFQTRYGQIHPGYLHFPVSSEAVPYACLYSFAVRYFLPDKPFLLSSDEVSAENSASFHHSLPALFYHQSTDRKSTRLNSSHVSISYAVFCLKKKKKTTNNKTRYIKIPKQIQTQLHQPRT